MLMVQMDFIHSKTIAGQGLKVKPLLCECGAESYKLVPLVGFGAAHRLKSKATKHVGRIG